VALRLASIREADGTPSLKKIAGEAAGFKQLTSHMGTLAVMDALREIIFFSGFVVLLNGCFLLRLALYTHATKQFMRHRAQWVSVFDSVGEIDASIAIANFLHQHPRHCRPTVSSDSVISIENGYHPLLQAPVPNSIHLVNSSALVTGSNMAGKTTFIKMVAMNIILGHTLGVCLADRATIPHSVVMALIRGEQSVESGKSRYFAEVEVIRDFIDRSATGQARVFVLDEPFSGTNTRERLGAATAVLGAISAHAQILVTTHDVELQHLLESRFDLFHFQEDPSVEGFFDFHLRAGAGIHRNAIKVLERLGFPAEVISKALTTIAALPDQSVDSRPHVRNRGPNSACSN
jgi:DNA mismatch repair ATPase MutS